VSGAIKNCAPLLNGGSGFDPSTNFPNAS